MYTCRYVYINVYIYIYDMIHLWISISISTYIYIYIYIYIYLYVYICIIYMHGCVGRANPKQSAATDATEPAAAVARPFSAPSHESSSDTAPTAQLNPDKDDRLQGWPGASAAVFFVFAAGYCRGMPSADAVASGIAAVGSGSTHDAAACAGHVLALSHHGGRQAVS